MTEQTTDHDVIPESKAARWAWRVSLIPLLGVSLFVLLAFIALYRIGSKGRTGFWLLRRGVVAVLFLSVLPIAGLIWWAELPNNYYIGLNQFIKHGRYDDYNGDLLRCSRYFFFGKQVKRVDYDYYYENGLKRSAITFTDRTVNGKFLYWYNNGVLSDDAFYIDGKLHGKTTRWYESGQMMSETNYINGKPIGESTYWHENGTIQVKENFVDGKRNGPCLWFNKDGKLERTMNYIDGISQEQIDAAKKAGVEPIIEIALGGAVKMRMIYIPPGEFMMGSTPEEIALSSKESYPFDKFINEAPRHRVAIKKGFYLCETELTQEQWQTIADNPSLYKGNNRPVANVTWSACAYFIKKLNSKANEKKRLPSEAEWEYACRARTSKRFGISDNNAVMADYVAFEMTVIGPNSVATKMANNFGLYDMYGNVSEWVEDDYHETYDNAPDDGRAWIDSPRNEDRLHRNGGYYSYKWDYRSSRRQALSMYYTSDTIGFRLAKSVDK